jgi:hypothetical protein
VHGEVIGKLEDDVLSIGKTRFKLDVRAVRSSPQDVRLTVKLQRNGIVIVDEPTRIRGCDEGHNSKLVVRYFMLRYAAWREVLWPEYLNELGRKHQ